MGSGGWGGGRDETKPARTQQLSLVVNFLLVHYLLLYIASPQNVFALNSPFPFLHFLSPLFLVRMEDSPAGP